MLVVLYRDILAANNIKKFAFEQYSGRGAPDEPVEEPTVVGPMKQEDKLLNNNKLHHG